MNCTQCDEFYEDDDYMYCSKHKEYVNTYSKCLEMEQKNG